MRYLKYIFGFQLFLGAIWCFYYASMWVGLLLILFSSVIFVPLIYRFLSKKFNNGFQSGCIIFTIFSVFAIFTGIWQLWLFFQPPDINKGLPIIVFENNLTKITNPCFTSFDKCFSKSVNTHEMQCNLINEAQNSCNLAQQDIENIVMPESIDNETKSLLDGVKVDAKNSLQNWVSVFSEYNKQCSSNSQNTNVNETKIQLVSAVKNKYLMDMKIKKLKTLVGLD